MSNLSGGAEFVPEQKTFGTLMKNDNLIDRNAWLINIFANAMYFNIINQIASMPQNAFVSISNK